MADESTGGETGGETSFDIFQRTVAVTPNNFDVHHTQVESLDDSAVHSIHRFDLQGDYEDLKAVRDAHYCNEIVTDDDTFMTPWTQTSGGAADKVIIGMNLTRRDGGRGTLTIMVKMFQRGYVGGIDFEVVSKDIHYWRQLCDSNVPDLNIIRQWEVMKDDPAKLDYYYQFKYQTAQGSIQDIPQDTATLALAQMIARGVESYNEYVPTLTITYNLAAHPLILANDFVAGGLLGKVVQNSDLTLSGTGFNMPLGADSAGASPVSDFENLPGDAILCTADQLQGNSDGSYTLTRCFSKFRKVEKELYVGAGGSYGPYDSDGTTGS